MSRVRLREIALQLMKLGVSRSGVERLMGHHEIDEIERQLAYLPFRKAKRPEAFIIDAVRNRYSAPTGYYHAKNETQAPGIPNSLDQDAEQLSGPLASDPQGHGTEGSPSADPSDRGLE